MNAPWTELALGELVDPVATVDPRDAFGGEPFSYIDLSAVDRDRKCITATTRLIGDHAPSRARQLLRRGDVLVSTVRPNLNAVAVVNSEHDGAVGSTGFTVLRPNRALDWRYLFHWVRTREFVASLVRKATGASYPAVSDRIVKAEWIALPPLDEQRRIARLLDACDTIQIKRRQSIGIVDSAYSLQFRYTFGKVDGNNGRWPSAALGSLAVRFSDGPFGSNLKTSDYVNAGVRVVRLQNIGVGEFDDSDATYVSEEHFATIARHECIPGDVLIATLGDPNIRACVLPDAIARAVNKADCVQMRVDPARATREYVVGLLNQPGLVHRAMTLSTGQTRTRISMSRLRELEVPVPPLSLQEHFGRTTAVLEASRARARSHLVSLEALFASLQHRAFNGGL